MNGLLFLTERDFTVQSGVKGDILCHGIKGFSLILFYSTQCQHCQNFIPKFKTLPGSIGGCQFGMINVSMHKSIIQMARNTIAPIEYVPYLILYINGRPFMKYDGPYESNEIRRFVVEVASQVQNKQQFVSEKAQNVPKSIPAYTIGKPIKGDIKNRRDVTYLDFNHAYKSN